MDTLAGRLAEMYDDDVLDALWKLGGNDSAEYKIAMTFRERIEAYDAAKAQPQQPSAWLHSQGNYSKVSERQLDDGEVARGWTQEPLYTQPQQPASPMKLQFDKESMRTKIVADPDVEPEVGPQSPRFFVEHGMIHDQVTGKHVTTCPDDEVWNGGTITSTLNLLNELDAKAHTKRVPDSKEEDVAAKAEALEILNDMREMARPHMTALDQSNFWRAREIISDALKQPSIMKALRRVEAERDALKQDAERYQFIRTHYDVSAMRRGFADLLALRPSDVKLPSTGPTMDLFIDGRRKGEQP